MRSTAAVRVFRCFLLRCALFLVLVHFFCDAGVVQASTAPAGLPARNDAESVSLRGSTFLSSRDVSFVSAEHDGTPSAFGDRGSSFPALLATEWSRTSAARSKDWGAGLSGVRPVVRKANETR